MKLKTTFLRMAFLAVFVCGSIAAQDINAPLLSYYFEQGLTNSGTLGTAGDLQADQGTPTYEESMNTGDYAFACNGANSLKTEIIQQISGAKARTITAWIYVTAADYAKEAAIISMGVLGDGKRFTFKYKNGGLRAEVQHGGGQHGGPGGIESPSGQLVQDRWNFVALTFPENGKLEDIIFYYGVSDSSVFSATFNAGAGHFVNTTPGPVYIGKQLSSSPLFLPYFSKIDGLRVYDFEATETQITAIKALTTLSIKNQAFAANELSVYPNAVTDYLNIESAVADKFEVMVFDMLGKVVTKANVTNKLDMSALATGLYIVKIGAGNKASSFKIAKK